MVLVSFHSALTHCSWDEHALVDCLDMSIPDVWEGESDAAGGALFLCGCAVLFQGTGSRGVEHRRQEETARVLHWIGPRPDPRPVVAAAHHLQTGTRLRTAAHFAHSQSTDYMHAHAHTNVKLAAGSGLRNRARARCGPCAAILDDPNLRNLTRFSILCASPSAAVFPMCAVFQPFAVVRIWIEGQVAREAATGPAEQQRIRTHLTTFAPPLFYALAPASHHSSRTSPFRPWTPWPISARAFLRSRSHTPPSHSAFCNFFHPRPPVSAFAPLSTLRERERL